MRGVIGHCRQCEHQGAKTYRESGARRSNEASLPPWRLTYDNCKVRKNAGERSVYLIDQEVSRVARILNVLACETKNFTEPIDRVGGVVRNILQIGERNVIEIIARKPMK